MTNEYPAHLRRQARQLWLTGQYTDSQIAATLGVPRADTIRDWRHQEGWPEFARIIKETIDDGVKARFKEELGAFRAKYDQLCQVIENRVVRALSNPNLPNRELRAIAGTLVQTQRLREKALSNSSSKLVDKLEGTVAGYYRDLHEAKAKEQRQAVIGRAFGVAPIDDKPSPAAETPAAEAT